jgi:putative ABC transport system substrate-binding protein
MGAYDGGGMNTRRKLIVALGSGALVSPFGSFAQLQTGRIVRLGTLLPLSPSAVAENFDGLRRGLRELGWVEGRNITFEHRYAEGTVDRLPALAAELVRLNVDAIFTASTPCALAVKNATGTIPIVMVTTGDPVASGLVTSLAHPGGNLSGVTALGRELSVKRLALLKEAVPKLNRVAVLTNPDNPENLPIIKSLELAAKELRVQLHVVSASKQADFEKAFRALSKERASGTVVLTDALFNTHRAQIVELAAKSRLPTIYGFRQDVDAGGLMFYGATLADMYYRAATYVDKILKGTKPSDLPVEQPTKFELVINMKTARSLGIKIPNSILVRADKAIE